MALVVFKEPIEFDWVKGNIGKNFIKHRITDKECEETLFDPQKIIQKDIRHSGKEERYLVLGMTRTQRLLFAVFTLRDQRVRIISVRDVNKKERKIYEKRT